MHVDEATLTEFALGILSPAESCVVQKEIDASISLQEELASIQHALQYIGQSEPALTSSDHAREMVLDSINDHTRFAGFLQRFADLFDLNTQVSQQLLDKIDQLTDSAWESTPFPGVTIMKFPGGPSVATATCGIVQVEPGKLFPAHQHQADELTLILQGSARDDSGNILAAGDISHSLAGSSHSFRILGEEIFVFAVVLYKNNKWLLVKTLVDYFQIKKK